MFYSILFYFILTPHTVALAQSAGKYDSPTLKCMRFVTPSNLMAVGNISSSISSRNTTTSSLQDQTLPLLTSSLLVPSPS